MKKGIITRKRGQEHRAELVNLINKFQHKYNIWQVWDDMIYLCASAISQTCQFIDARESQYLSRIKRYPKELSDLFPKMFAEIVLAFQQEGFADILGELYMQLDLGDHWKGQYFTPYEICLMMSKMLSENPAEEVKKKGYITVSDPACGSGAMLISHAQNCFDKEVNYQQNVLFVAQDIDPVVARMCYIQLSLLGCLGYVIVGNIFTQPAVGHVLFPMENNGCDIWFTPMFFAESWHYRRVWKMFEKIL